MRVLITGGLGHLGCNFAAHRMERGDDVVVLDNYSAGLSCRYNEIWLKKIAAKHRSKFSIVPGDVSIYDECEHVFDVYRTYDAVLHAASSPREDVEYDDPKLSFATNVIGTFTLLELFRERNPEAKMVVALSNKIYDILSWPTELVGSRYHWIGRRVGPAEVSPFLVDAKEPEGASNLAMLYYARCYAALYQMPIVSIIPSCVYGPRQFMKSGWVGRFIIATQIGLPITIHGDGFQVRDLCHVEDACRAIDLLFKQAMDLKGEIFNVGGGPRNAISLIDALTRISMVDNKFPKGARYVDWFPYSSKVYISNIEKMIGLGWVPKVTIEDGIQQQVQWAQSEEATLKRLYGMEDSHVGVQRNEDAAGGAVGV